MGPSSPKETVGVGWLPIPSILLSFPGGAGNVLENSGWVLGQISKEGLPLRV